MTRKGPTEDIDESQLEVSPPTDYAGGVPAVLVSMQHAFEQMGAVRTAKTLPKVNQRDGFDCPGCAWPERPGGRKLAEFCENGAKAVSEEATLRRVTPRFFAEHSVEELRSHDQFNTTIYGLDDRYRGVKNGRRVVFVNPEDIAELGLSDGAMVDLVSEWTTKDGTLEERRAEAFRVVSYSTPKGNAAAYYPETNPLVPLDHVAKGSNTPVSKGVVVRLELVSGP